MTNDNDQFKTSHTLLTQRSVILFDLRLLAKSDGCHQPQKTFGPFSSAATTCSATTSCMGYVGCKLFSQKYWLTGMPQPGSKVSKLGVPLGGEKVATLA